MRKTMVPRGGRAKSQLKSAVRAPPTCKYPVGEGAKRTRTLPASLIGSLILVRARWLIWRDQFNETAMVSPTTGPPAVILARDYSRRHCQFTVAGIQLLALPRWWGVTLSPARNNKMAP